MPRTFSDDADECRYLAREVSGEADRACLIRIAREFDALAHAARCADRPYYAARAAQEVTAAVQARHPRARLAHLHLAQHYEAIAQGQGSASA